MKSVPTALLVVLAACAGGGGGAGGAAAPVPESVPVAESATGAVDAFMQAVADSNIVRMGQLWGTTRGPAAVTGEPVSWQRQLIVVHAYLRGGTYRTTGNVPLDSDQHRQVTVELDRGVCVRQVPFRVRRLASGHWLVVQVDVSQAGNPARPCGDL